MGHLPQPIRTLAAAAHLAHRKRVLADAQELSPASLELQLCGAPAPRRSALATLQHDGLAILHTKIFVKPLEHRHAPSEGRYRASNHIYMQLDTT